MEKKLKYQKLTEQNLKSNKKNSMPKSEKICPKIKSLFLGYKIDSLPLAKPSDYRLDFQNRTN